MNIPEFPTAHPLFPGDTVSVGELRPEESGTTGHEDGTNEPTRVAGEMRHGDPVESFSDKGRGLLESTMGLIRERPLASFGLAFAVGWLIAVATKRRGEAPDVEGR